MPLDTWSQSLITAMYTLWERVVNFIPNLFAALVVALLGFVVARLADTLLSKLLDKLGLDRLMRGTGLPRMLLRMGIKAPVSTLVGKVVYWFILLLFLVSAVQWLGLQRVSSTLDSLALYLPKVFVAAVVLLIGIFVAQALNSLVKASAEGVGMDYAGAIGRLVQGLILIASLSIAIGQMDIKIDIVNIIIGILLACAGLAVALALGLGSQRVAGQIVSGIYIRDLYAVGEHIKVGELEGQIQEIGTVKTTLLLVSGEEASIANRVLLEQPVIRR